MMDLSQILIELSPGQEYTLVHFNKQGWPQRINFYLRQTGYHRIGAQTLIRIVIKPVNAPIRYVLIDPSNQFVIWNGFVNPDCQIIISTYIKDSGHGHLKMGRTWSKFDPRYIEKAIASISAESEPVVYNIKPIKKEQLHDLCYVID